VSAELTQAAPADRAPGAPKRAGVVGASGILGGELLRILLGHPGLELEYVSAQSKAGRPATELNPHLKDAGLGEFEPFDARVAAKRCDVVFLATPPETAGRAVPELNWSSISARPTGSSIRSFTASGIRMSSATRTSPRWPPTRCPS
jgi:hypothetical protein